MYLFRLIYFISHDITLLYENRKNIDILLMKPIYTNLT